MRKRISKKTIFAAAMITIVSHVCTVNPVYPEELKIGYVDSQKVLENSLAGKQVEESLKEYTQTRQKIVDIDKAELEKLQDEVSRQTAILSPEARQEKQELLQKKFMEYQKKVGELQKEIQQKESEKLEEFNDKLEKIVQAIGEKEGYTIVFNNPRGNIVLFAKPSLDLTKRVTEEMDKNIKKEEKSKR